jgi:hypothetical protein
MAERRVSAAIVSRHAARINRPSTMHMVRAVGHGDPSSRISNEWVNVRR